MCEPPTTHFGPGDFNGDLTMSFDIRLEDTGAITMNPMGLNYTAVKLSTDGTWSMGNPKKIEGKVNFPVDTWHKVAMRLFPDGRQATYVNGVELVGLPVESSLLDVHGIS